MSSKEIPRKTLVFLHGWGVNSQLWFKIAPALIKKNYSLYFIDLPGFGQSQTPPESFDLDQYKSVVEKFISNLRLKNVVMIGHSFGGSIAIKISIGNPSYLEKLVLVNAAGVRHTSALKRIRSIFANVARPFFSLSFMQPIRARYYQMIGSEYLNIPSMSKVFARVVSENLMPFLSDINIPTLIISGDNDKVTPVFHAKEMNNKIKNSKLVIFSAGHFSFLDQPEEFVNVLTKFI